MPKLSLRKELGLPSIKRDKENDIDKILGSSIYGGSMLGGTCDVEMGSGLTGANLMGANLMGNNLVGTGMMGGAMYGGQIPIMPGNLGVSHNRSGTNYNVDNFNIGNIYQIPSQRRDLSPKSLLEAQTMASIVGRDTELKNWTSPFFFNAFSKIANDSGAFTNTPNRNVSDSDYILGGDNPVPVPIAPYTGDNDVRPGFGGISVSSASNRDQIGSKATQRGSGMTGGRVKRKYTKSGKYKRAQF